MRNLITYELGLIEEHGFKLDLLDLEDNFCIPKLTPRNVSFIEAIINVDSSYRKDGDNSKEPIESNRLSTDGSIKLKYYGSTAYWMSKLYEYLSENKSSESFEDIMKGCVKALDADNNTHLNADGVGLEQISNRIVNYYSTNPQRLKDDLMTWDSAEELFRLIAKKTDVTIKQRNPDKKHHPRINFSFASKFIHNVCYYIFKDEPEQDNFSIYDNVLANAIRIYAWYYLGDDCRIETNNEDVWEQYKKYCETIDRIIKVQDEPISRNGLDHLLWYYFKGMDTKTITQMRKMVEERRK